MQRINHIIMKNIVLIILLISTICASNMIPPDIPQILGVAYDGKVVLTWNKLAEESIDEKTGYSDFEGYKLYKSTDGGLTWGDPDDRIYYDGEAKGWADLAQFDLTDIEYKIEEGLCRL